MKLWKIPERVLAEMLRRAADGEDPDVIMAEAYANADHEGAHS